MPHIVNCPATHSVKNKAARQVPLYGGGAAQRRGGQRTQECTTHLSLRAIADGVAISFLLLCRSGAYARTYHIHWIATVALLPRDDKE